MALTAPAPTLAPDARSFRAALGRFTTGVAFVTAAPDGEPAGLIVNSLTSVSLEPPLVSFCPSRRSLTWQRMRQTRRFGVNVLGQHHEQFALRATPAGAKRFDGLDWSPGPGGTPLLTDALAILECRIVAEHAAGDHWIVIGRVVTDTAPLVFFAGTFIAVQEQRPRCGSASSERRRVGSVRACDRSSNNDSERADTRCCRPRGQ